MTRQNRVRPDGSIAADAGRGLFTGNRGILHDASGQLAAARWRHPHWIICALNYKGIRRPIMAPGSWTELFFLDEAVALAAGHRPCALCRREAYLDYRAGWTAVYGRQPTAPEIDRALHRARVAPRNRRQIRHAAPFAGLPDGTFIAHEGAFWLVLGSRLRRFSPGGYDAALPRPTSGEAEVMTPAPSVAVLAQGYRPTLHPSA